MAQTPKVWRGLDEYSDSVEDWVLQGFEGLLAHLPQLGPKQRAERARALWESLGDLEERRGREIFDGKYSWTHNGKYAVTFPSAFVRRLNEAAWIPDADGVLHPPRLVAFERLGWKPNPFLLTKIQFKPHIIDQLAKEAGIDPAALDLLRKYGITSVAELASRLGIIEVPTAPEIESVPENESDELPTEVDVYGDAKDLYGDDMPDIPPGTPDSDGGDGVGSGVVRDGQGRARTGSSRGGHGNGGSGYHAATGGKGSMHGGGQGKGAPGHAVGRPFISYVGAHPDDGGADPDGLYQAERMQIERHAIDLIIGLEPRLRRTTDGNHHFDLYEADSSGRKIRWVKVKSMMGSWEDRPVGLSYTQFDCAREKGDAYWLYVVEHANDAAQARVLRIQNPVGQSRTFTFDHGWSHIARTDLPG
jgi:hypothetical protein